jgi:hypothetical protein
LFKSETQRELLQKLLSDPDMISAEDRDKLIKNLINNMGNLDRYITKK